MQSLTTIRELLASRGLRPKHRLGQNFLHDQNQIRKLLAAADVRAGETVLEVGPGTGTLTEALVDAGAEVVACELDPEMADIVAERLGSRIVLVRGDCLDGKRRIAPAVRDALRGRPFKLVANLPYGAATPLMALLLTDHPECSGQFVTVQREVAERLAAKPGGKEYGPLSVLAQTLATVEIVSILPASCFWPAPDVTSAMIAIRRRPRRGNPPPRTASPISADNAPRAVDRADDLADRDIDDPRGLSVFAARLFATRRKQLGTILGRGRALPPGIDPAQRPESLTPAQVVRLWRSDAGAALATSPDAPEPP
ncbi:MAG: 16S rRNA (adenine(1518)-N(6)/adenine(1519)-N(6))-dimethyltransferase RsmA [Phycisphaerales bacterium]